MKQEYVLGFVFDAKLERVLLIKKNRGPKNVAMTGKLNGLGGHVEEYDNSVYTAMRRECFEECGLDINEEDWIKFCMLDAEFGIVYCFYAIINSFYKLETKYGGLWNDPIYKSMEDEQVCDYWVKAGCKVGVYGDYTELPHMANLDWMIPMALNHFKNLDTTECFEVKELH